MPLSFQSLDSQCVMQLSQLNKMRTCEEMKEYGVNESGFYLVDPDGPLIGEDPIRVYCEFKNGLVSTKLSHNSEERIMVQHCPEPGCYSRKISYYAPMSQILSLIQLSEGCTQEVRTMGYQLYLKSV